MWDPDAKPLTDNFFSAKSWLLLLESRLCKNPEVQVGYVKTNEDDIANGHVRKVPLSEVKTTHCLPQWYLPHHPVVNPNKPNKIRRVCNAAACFAGNSLSADLEPMFMQVEIPEHEQRLIRFLWR